MMNNTSISQYSPESEDNNDDQPLDFSKKPTLKFNNRQDKIHFKKIKNEQTDLTDLTTTKKQKSPAISTATTNYLTTPSPSPPDQVTINNSNTNQVLCQLLTGNLIPTSTGKVVPASSSHSHRSNAIPIPVHSESLHLNHTNNGLNSSLSSSPPIQIQRSNSRNSFIKHDNSLERNNPSVSPSGSTSPIGLGPLNQVDVHFSHSPKSSGVDRFGTSGGLLTTASLVSAATGTGVMPNAFPGVDAKRAMRLNRPFKAYPRDPLSIPYGYYGVPMQMPLTTDAIASQSLYALQSEQAYLEFRQKMLDTRKSSHVNRTTKTHNGNGTNENGLISTPPKQQQENSMSPQNMYERSNERSNERTSTGNMDQQQQQQQQQQQRQQQNDSNSSLNSNSSLTQNGKTTNVNGNGSMQMQSSQVTHIQDDNSQYSNENSSGGEGETGSMYSNQGNTCVSTVTGVSGGHSLTQTQGQSMRKRGRPLPEDLKDEAYWERRRKNNEAAKRSRDARRAKEDEIAIRAAFLEQENLKLRCEMVQLREENAKLRQLSLYNHH